MARYKNVLYFGQQVNSKTRHRDQIQFNGFCLRDCVHTKKTNECFPDVLPGTLVLLRALSELKDSSQAVGLNSHSMNYNGTYLHCLLFF